MDELIPVATAAIEAVKTELLTKEAKAFLTNSGIVAGDRAAVEARFYSMITPLDDGRFPCEILIDMEPMLNILRSIANSLGGDFLDLLREGCLNEMHFQPEVIKGSRERILCEREDDQKRLTVYQDQEGALRVVKHVEMRYTCLAELQASGDFTEEGTEKLELKFLTTIALRVLRFDATWTPPKKTRVRGATRWA